MYMYRCTVMVKQLPQTIGDALMPAVDVAEKQSPAKDLSSTAAWSRRVRRVGGLIQAAFAAFWLVRGSVVIGGEAAAVLLAVFGVLVIGVFFYAFSASAGV